jgi:hypothetical protein
MMKWDGSHLGSYENIIKNEWKDEGIKYYELEILDNNIVCTGYILKNMLPCIVEDIKKIFGIYSRGFHLITINKKLYIIYKKCDDMSLKVIDNDNRLLNDIKSKIQKVILFSDIMYLESLNKSALIIRKLENIYVSTNINTKCIKEVTNHDGTTIPKLLFNRWFDEKTPFSKYIKEMISYNKEKCEEDDRLCYNTSKLRTKIDTIINKYDKNYIWYTDIILTRVIWYITNY